MVKIVICSLIYNGKNTCFCSIRLWLFVTGDPLPDLSTQPFRLAKVRQRFRRHTIQVQLQFSQS